MHGVGWGGMGMFIRDDAGVIGAEEKIVILDGGK
jgi:hypothetical protein